MGCTTSYTCTLEKTIDTDIFLHPDSDKNYHRVVSVAAAAALLAFCVARARACLEEVHAYEVTLVYAVASRNVSNPYRDLRSTENKIWLLDKKEYE